MKRNTIYAASCLAIGAVFCITLPLCTDLYHNPAKKISEGNNPITVADLESISDGSSEHLGRRVGLCKKNRGGCENEATQIRML